MITTQNNDFRPECCLDTLVRIGLWVASRATDTGPDAAVNGPILPKCEIDALGIPIEDILRQLAGEPVVIALPTRELNYWDGSIVRAAFSKDGERPVHFAPGEPVPKGSPHHIELAAKMGCMPLSDTISAIEKLAFNHGIPADEFLFTWRGVRITDADMLFRMVRLKPDDAGALADALPQWRDQCISRIAQARATAGEKYTIPVPAWVRGALLPRPILAENLGFHPHTLYTWDRQGYASHHDLVWQKGVKISGNLVLIDVEANWPTIEALIGRESRKAAVRREKIRNSVEAFMYGQNPVLDAVIANEERSLEEKRCKAS